MSDDKVKQLIVQLKNIKLQEQQILQQLEVEYDRTTPSPTATTSTSQVSTPTPRPFKVGDKVWINKVTKPSGFLVNRGKVVLESDRRAQSPSSKEAEYSIEQNQAQKVGGYQRT
jgi:hypothetical protein